MLIDYLQKDYFKKLRKEKNAVLLAHYYHREEIQKLADFVGDSPELSQNARQTNASIIVFAGVHFMAEIQSIPIGKKILFAPNQSLGKT
ncbi:MAG: quinolinate synthase NadA [Cyclobacteriaceae bacterium]